MWGGWDALGWVAVISGGAAVQGWPPAPGPKPPAPQLLCLAWGHSAERVASAHHAHAWALQICHTGGARGAGKPGALGLLTSHIMDLLAGHLRRAQRKGVGAGGVWSKGGRGRQSRASALRPQTHSIPAGPGLLSPGYVRQHVHPLLLPGEPRVPADWMQRAI